MTPEDPSKIEDLKKSLYSRNAPEVRTKRRLRFSPQEHEVPTDWEHPKEEESDVKLNEEYENHTMAFTTKLFVGSLIFFVMALSIGAFLIFNGENIISANNIDIMVNGPVTVAGGEQVTFDVQVKNRNNITLETVDLDVDFPSGTVNPVDRSKELREFRELMDNIRAGTTGQKRVNAVLYGEENSKKIIKINVTYRVAGSNAVFKKTKDYEVLISSSPLSLTVDGFKEVTAGQEFELTVNLVSNSTDVIRNLLLRAEYPFGYTLTSTDVKAEGNKSTWKVGDIPPKGKKTIKFKGQLEGQDGEVRAFRFTVGAQSSQNPGAIATEYIAAAKEISIEKPFVSTAIAFSDDDGTGEFATSFNTPINTTLSWFNNLSTAITDAELVVKLSGNAFDKNSVSPGQGFYQSADNKITWSQLTTQGLSSIGAGDNGSINFTFTPRNFTTPSRQVVNPTVTVEVNVSGKRLSETNVPERVTSSAKRTVKISSNLSLSSTLSRANLPFENTGPIPPKPEQPTTYTITWTVNNTVNTVSGAEVKAKLPVYLNWTGKISPSTEDVGINRNTNEVSWKVGNINTFTAGTNYERKVSFQVVYTPSAAQVGQVPIIMETASLTGEDDFTGANLSATADPLTTRFNDANFQTGQDVVTQ